jgi:hypothetical protein
MTNDPIYVHVYVHIAIAIAIVNVDVPALLEDSTGPINSFK